MTEIFPSTTLFYQVLGKWRELTFGTLVPEDVLEEVIALKNPITGDYINYWSLSINKEKYLIQAKDGIREKFPIVINDTKMIRYRNKVYNHIYDYDSVRIDPLDVVDGGYSIKTIIDTLASFKHTNKRHQLLSTIVGVTAYIDRININVCSNGGFGKDSIYKILGSLKSDVSVFNPESLPAIEYRLNNNTLVLDELSNLKDGQIALTQKLFLLAGDFSIRYEKSKRGIGIAGGQDVYKIDYLSLVVMYNNFADYREVGQEEGYFDKVFKGPVQQRFLKMKFEGEIVIDQFKENINPSYTVKEYGDEIMKLSKSIEWHKINIDTYDKYNRARNCKFNLIGRQPLSYHRIIKTISNYCEDDDILFSELCNEFDTCINAYKLQFADGDSLEGF